MSDTIFLERCQAYLDCHLKASKGRPVRSVDQLPAVTISRQSGAGGRPIAQELAVWLQKNAPKASYPWTVFDKNLVQRVLEDHNLPARLAQFMPEDKVSGIADAMEELLGLHPPSWNLARQFTETILKLAELGNVILVGRGANVVTWHLDHVFHVRLVGSLDCRAERVMARHKIGRASALEFIAREDAGRRRYLKKYFSKEVDDPLLYHLTLNTDLVEPAEACEIIGPRVLARAGG